MRRVPALLLATLVVALPAQGAEPTPRIKNTKGEIESIAMDGPRVAYAVSGGSGCTKVIVLNVLTRGAAVASGTKTCDADNSSTGAGVREIAVAGLRIAWIVNQGGNSESNDYLYTATLGGARERLVSSAFRSGDVDGVLSGAWIGHLVGSGDRMAVNRFTTNTEGTITQASLQRLDTGLWTLALGIPSLYAASLDLHRVAVLRTDQKVAIYDTETRKLLLTITPTSAREIALRKDYLVVLTRTKTVEVYNSHTGKLLRTWPVAAGASRLDVHSGIAVYAVGRTVFELRLTDGRDAPLATAPRAIEGLEIEAPGVAYAYNTFKSLQDVGNLAFVPLRQATSLLRSGAN
jgi:hypothetical protein